MSHPITTSQTIGPFSHEAWRWAVDASAAGALQTTANTVVIEGAIHDGDGAVIDDAMIEAWLPGAEAAEARQQVPAFRRVPSGLQGEFQLTLSLPRPAASGDPVAYITVFARGLVKHQFCAVFLEDDAGLAQSAILEQVPAGRRATLIAARQSDGRYRWDIHLQGTRETVFFDYV